MPADGLFRVQTYEPDVLLSGLPPVDPDREEVQAGMTSDGETLLAAQTEQLLVDMLGSQTPAGVDEETAARVEDAIRQLQPITVEVRFSKEGIIPGGQNRRHRRSWRTGIPWPGSSISPLC